VQLRREGDQLVALGVLQLAPDLAVQCRASVSPRTIERVVAAAAKGREGTIGWFGEDIWNGAKKIAKDIVSSDVLRKVANTFSDPRFMGLLSVIPGVGPVAAQGMSNIGTAWNGLRAATLSSQGLNDAAAALSMQSAQQAAALGVPAEVFNAAQRYGAGLAVDPQMLAYIQQMAPATLNNMVATLSAPPAPPVAPPPPPANIQFAPLTPAAQRAIAQGTVWGPPTYPATQAGLQALAAGRPSTMPVAQWNREVGDLITLRRPDQTGPQFQQFLADAWASKPGNVPTLGAWVRVLRGQPNA
jgi:hypothetical protein